MPEWLIAVLGLIGGILGSSGFWAILQHRMDKHDASKKLLLALAHDKLFERCHHYIARGTISAEELENLTELYESYHTCGGNGTGTSLYKRAATLPIHTISEKEI